MIKHRISVPPVAHGLIDQFMPAFDANEYHETMVRAPIDRVYASLRTADLGDSPIIKLFRAYWALIAPFSGLIRREVLRAIRRRSELTP